MGLGHRIRKPEPEPEIEPLADAVVDPV